MTHGAGVAELARESVVAIDHVASDDDTAADAGAESNHDEILHTLGYSVGHLTHCSRIGIVGKRHGQSAKSLGKKLLERNSALGSPHKIGCKGDLTGVVVAVGGTYSHSPDLTFLAGLFDERLDGFSKSADIILGIFTIVCTDNALLKHDAVGIDHSDLGSLTTYVDSYHIILFHTTSQP